MSFHFYVSDTFYYCFDQFGKIKITSKSRCAMSTFILLLSRLLHSLEAQKRQMYFKKYTRTSIKVGI